MGLLRADIYRLSRLGLLRAAAAFLLLAAVLRGVVWPPAPDTPWQGVWSFFPVTAVLIIVTAVTVGQEFAGGTFRGLVARGVARWHLLAVQFITLAALGGLLLGGTEGLATWLGVRSTLDPSELLRAWLSLWPYIALVMLLAVIARQGGVALVVGVLQLAMEHAYAVFTAPLTAFPEMIPKAFRVFTHVGLGGTLYQWSLSYNSANWTYLADFQRAPMPVNLLLYALPNPALRSGLLLVAYTLLGLGLSAVVLYRRDVTEVVEGKGLWRDRVSRQRRQTPVVGSPPAALAPLPIGTGRGPRLVRLMRAHLFRMGRTAVVRISAVMALLLPLTLWGAGALAQEIGNGNLLWGYGTGHAPPLAFALSLLAVGPLATVVAALAVSGELTLGTRRMELVRGVGRLEVIAAQSLGLLLVAGAVLVLVAGASILIGVQQAGTWYLLPAITEVVAGTLGAGVYVTAVQVGGALTRSSTGALLLGIGFLAVDWVLLLAPTISTNPGLLQKLSPYSAAACILAAASWSRMDTLSYGWQLLDLAPALLILAAYTLLGHALAVILAHRRDA